MKVLFVFGTRPEAIKMAPVVKTIGEDPAFEAKICVTGQHRQMLDQVLELFNIHPDFDLNIMEHGQDLTDITCNVLSGMQGVYEEWLPDIVFVHGDTTTSLAVGLSAFYAKIKLAHVEAGLRTHNKFAPWPEEMNRSLTGQLTDVHLAPTLAAKENLLQSGVKPSSIHVTGNTVIDALNDVNTRLRGDDALRCSCESQFSYLDAEKQLILVTGHRRENFGQGFENICRALNEIAARDDVQIIYSLHPNQKVQNPVRHTLADINNVIIIEPLDYLSFVYLMGRSKIILTDSGGIQEETPSLGKPVLLMRDTTERPEAIDAGTVKLVGTDPNKIVTETNLLLDNVEVFQEMC